MGVTANTVETYDVSTIFDDLPDTFTSITPKETPFINAIGTRNAKSTYFEWTEVDLAAASGSNRVIEGEAAPDNDAVTAGVRKGNYSQISDKVIETSETAEAVDGVADIQTQAKQAVFKVAELKRDMEKMLLDNVAGSAGATGTARQSAGLPAFLITNTDRGPVVNTGDTAGADPTTSGAGGAGYPDTAATDATTPRELTEALLLGVIADVWTAGGDPTMILCGPKSKQKISAQFGVGTVDRAMVADKKKLTLAVDVYVSDFGSLQVVPARHIRARDVFVLDPSKMGVAYLHKLRQKPLAETGHSKRRLIWAEYGLQVDSEKAQGVIADIDPAL